MEMLLSYRFRRTEIIDDKRDSRLNKYGHVQLINLIVRQIESAIVEGVKNRSSSKKILVNVIRLKCIECDGEERFI